MNEAYVTDCLLSYVTATFAATPQIAIGLVDLLTPA